MVIEGASPASGNQSKRTSRFRTPIRACSRCRSLHKKCDIYSKDNTCSNCETAGILCKGGGNSELRIRFSEFSHPPRKLQNATNLFKLRPIRKKSDGTGQLGCQNNEAPNSNQHTPSSSKPELSGSITGGPEVPQHDSLDLVAGVSSFEGPPEATSGYNKKDSSLNDSDANHWPLNIQEAKIVQHFFTFWIPFFDYCCTSSPFRSYIQSAIRNDPGILYAVLAVSARHLEKVRKGDYGSNDYEQKCLGILIPMLNENEAAKSQDDALLVSALLLRLLDEMTDPSDSQLVIRHTVSAPLFLRIRQHSSQPSELSNTAMAIVLRQEVYVSIMTKRPVELASQDCGIDDSLEPAPDVMWTYRIMAHTSRVINYAYGSDVRNEACWDQLWSYLEEWRREAPPTFNPLNQLENTSISVTSPPEAFVQPGESFRGFPQIYYTHDCPIAGQQYLEICKIILLAHDPRTPGLGLGRNKYVKAQEDKIRDAVRNVCGIWTSNPTYLPARVLAGLVIGMTGELFTDPSEVVHLLEIISDAEIHIGWPCLKVTHKLREYWISNDVIS